MMRNILPTIITIIVITVVSFVEALIPMSAIVMAMVNIYTDANWLFLALNVIFGWLWGFIGILNAIDFIREFEKK